MDKRDDSQGKATPVSLGNYQSSRVFAELKNIKERIGVDSNLTTPQYLRIYDELLDNAVRPILENSRFFDSYLIRIVGWQERNFRRKVSFLKRAEFPRLAINFLLKMKAEDRFAAYQELRLDRLLRAQVVSAFHTALTEYEKACNAELEPKWGINKESFCLQVKTDTEEAMRSEPGALLMAKRESVFWSAHASDFKRMLMEKYTRLCLTTAKRDYVEYFKCQVSFNDLIQTYLLAASRAIDKCDAKQGALTSHIQNWFFSARDAVARQRDRNTVSLDDDQNNERRIDSTELPTTFHAYEKERESSEDIAVIAELSRIADPHGAARVLLGIPEHLKESEVKTILLQRKKEHVPESQSATLAEIQDSPDAAKPSNGHRTRGSDGPAGSGKPPGGEPRFKPVKPSTARGKGRGGK